MKKTLILCVAAIVMMSSMSVAAESSSFNFMGGSARVETMGYVNNIVKDVANIYLFPSTVNFYPNEFYGEFYDGDFDAAGATFRFNENNPWVMGAFFSEDDYYHTVLNYSGPDKATSPYADSRIHLFYGRYLNDMPFGFGLSIFGDAQKQENDTVSASSYERSLRRYEIALGISPMEQKMDIGLRVGFTSWTEKEYDGTDAIYDESKPKGNMDVMFNARYWMDPMGKYILVPHLGFYYFKQGIEGYDTDNTLLGEYTTKQTIIDLGLGMNYEAAEDILVVTDFGLMLDSYKSESTPAGGTATESKNSTKSIPYFKIGIDAKVLKWMDLRAGVSSYWENYTSEPVPSRKYTSSYASTDLYLGAGFHWGNLDLDVSVEPEFLENGPYFVSGEGTDYIFERVSLTYYFD